TQGSANPGLTIQSVAARTANYIIAERDQILNRQRGSRQEPPIRHDLSPPGTYQRGVPRSLSMAARDV
ncbi:MAG: hypothetical protein ACRDFX_02960, partial [Chloroflexota bacterium]